MGVDPRHRRKLPKPEQSGLTRIDQIQIFGASAISNYDEARGSARKKSDPPDDSAFVRSMEKLIRRKKRLP